MLKRYFAPETLLFLACWAFLLGTGQARLFRDPGTFWHTVVGERILCERGWQQTDSFTFTRSGQSWLPHQWLGECSLALLHRLAGFDTQLLAACTLLAGLFTWAVLGLLRAGVHWSVVGCLLVLAVGASSSHFHIRPHLATMVGVPVTVSLLAGYEAGRHRVRTLFWLVPLFILWSNTHGGVLGGWLTLGLVSGYWLLSWLVGLPSPIMRTRDAGAVVLVSVLCPISCLLNPFGLALPITWFDIMHSSILPTIIVEHAPLQLTRSEGWLVVSLGVLYLTVLMGLKPSWPRATWFVPLLWLALSYSRVRHAPLFALSTLVLLGEVWPSTRWSAWLANWRSDFFSPTEPGQSAARWRVWLVPACVVSGSLCLHLGRLPTPVVGPGWAKLAPDYWPVEVLPSVRQAAETEPGAHVFNEYLYGGFLIYFAPELPIFVDDRCELFGDRWLAEYVRAEHDQPAERMQAWQAEFGSFAYALTHTGSGYDQVFAHDPAWQCICSSPTANWYRRVR